MQTSPSVAIVILNYNGKHYLEKFLPSVVASSYINKKVVVADNASTDDSIEWLKKNYPEVDLIVLSNNYGFAKGYNLALKQVEAEYYILLNSDVEVTPGWIAPVIELMNADKQVGACQPKILSYKSKTQFEYAGACGGWIDILGYPFSRGRVFDDCEEDSGQYDEVSNIFWASGAAMFVRAATYHAMHGLDEFFFAHQEEIDLCWRMQSSGYKIMVCPSSVVYHVGGGTLQKGERKAYLNFRNNLIMLYKNSTFSQTLWKLPARIALDFSSAIKSLISGDVAFFKGVCRAHFAFWSWMFSSKKQSIFPSKKSKTLQGMYNGSIVWQYFIKHKKTFAEIVLKTK